MSWTAEQVLALAPDASSASSGKGLASPRKWATLGANETCAWGTIQGSGKTPYQTSIDLTGPAFKCSCPSRKFPCKHGLGLFLILAQQPTALTQTQPPAWTVEWLSKRTEKEEKKKVKAPEAEVDPEASANAAAAAAKRAASRETRVTAGLSELEIWLHDLVRSGLASLPGKPLSFWEQPATRLIDAQAPGLARRVSALGSLSNSGEQWPGKLLRAAALLHLAKEGWSRLAELPEATQADLRAVIGFTTSQEELLALPAVRDQWMVLAQRIEEDERLRTQRIWLFGMQTKRAALALSFSASPSQPLDISLVPGTTIDAELVFFPGAWPLRALVKQRYATLETPLQDWPHSSIVSALAYAAEALIANPWTERLGFALGSVTPTRKPGGWTIRDSAGDTLPLLLPEPKAWILHSVSGGKPVNLAGEWDGERFLPLSTWAEGRFLRL